jgi:hypothetical protein
MTGRPVFHNETRSVQYSQGHYGPMMRLVSLSWLDLLTQMARSTDPRLHSRQQRGHHRCPRLVGSARCVANLHAPTQGYVVMYERA